MEVQQEGSPEAPEMNPHSAKGLTNRTLDVHERVDSRFLVLSGSESTITEITDYIHDACATPQWRPRQELAWIWTDFLNEQRRATDCRQEGAR